MKLTQINHELENYLLIHDVVLEDQDIDLIVSYIHENNFIQILYKFDIRTLLSILHMMEDNEMYETCTNIVKVIENHNKLENKNYPTNYR